MKPEEGSPSLIKKPPESITLWVIYERPDITDGFVLRPQFSAKKTLLDYSEYGWIETDLGNAVVVISRLLWHANTVDELHSIMPPSCVRIGPEPGDKPGIIEVWME